MNTISTFEMITFHEGLLTMIKQIILSLVFLIGLAIIFNFPPYSSWFKNTILDGYKVINTLINVRDENSRKEMKIGTNFHIYERMDMAMRQADASQEPGILLIPSNEFLRLHKITTLLDEPSVIYYLSGLRTVLPYTQMARNATWALVLKDGEIALSRIKQPQQLDSLIQLYKSFPYIL